MQTNAIIALNNAPEESISFNDLLLASSLALPFPLPPFLSTYSLDCSSKRATKLCISLETLVGEGDVAHKDCDNQTN